MGADASSDRFTLLSGHPPPPSAPEKLHVEIPQAQNDLTTKFIRNRSGPAESDEVREAKALLADLREQEAQANAEYRSIVQHLSGV